MRAFRLLSTIIVLNLFTVSVWAQEDDIEVILETGAHDANLLAEYYLQPLFDGFGYGFSNGWYNTAKPHQTLGFDITITANFAEVPDARKFFTIIESEFNSITLANPNDNQSPTVFGPGEPGPTLNYSYTDPETNYTFTGSFEAWEGLDLKETIGFDRVPAPTIQAGIGLIKNTELIIRYIPNINSNIDDGSNKVGVFGLGLKHDIGQWIPGLKMVPIDISLLGAYSGMNNTYSFDDQDNAKQAIFDVNNWTVQLLVSKKVSVFTFYGGMGYTSIISKFQLKGTYEIEDDNFNTISLEDPINLEYTAGNFKGTLGMRLKFGVFTLHSDYTFQEYNIISAGIGLSFR